MDELLPISQIFTNSQISLILKISVLFLLGLYNLFVLVIFNHIRSFKRILIINQTEGSSFIQKAALIYIIISFSLFLAALAIL
ncbi:MAG: hypothetical protein KatS3mg089_0011 [Patescibacteria group bacterium]|nr:MAG: hypothetical protein KatS3mg089_0011 [Patescibacteria group bacterium]